MNRAEMRDFLRRALNKVPAIDVGIGPDGGEAKKGDPAPSTPQPTNPQINQAIDTAISRISMAFNGLYDPELRRLDVAAQTANGPFYIDLQRIGLGLANGSVFQVVTAKWYVSGSTPLNLTQASIENWDQDRPQWGSMPPGLPTKILTGGTKIGLWPAPAAAGELEVTVGVRLKLGPGDLDTLDGLFEDELIAVMDIAKSELAATQPRDEVMQARWQTSEADRERSSQQLAMRVTKRLGLNTNKFNYTPTRGRR